MKQVLSLWGGKPLWEGYRLRRKRGSGGFGEVWEAQTDNGTGAALKFISSHDSFSSAKEVRNIQAIRALKHPNLIHVERVWSSQGYLVVGMELADGSLADVLDISMTEVGVGLSQSVVCHYLTEAAHAIDFLNARQHTIAGRVVGIQHCDIKPGNLLVLGDQLKLSDFGLSTQLAGPLAPFTRAGTIAYAAPEIFAGYITQWSDQFSFAITFCELRTGRLPFPPAPPTFEKTYVYPEPDLTLLTPEEAKVIRRALSKVPQKRWPTCGEMMAQLTASVPADAASV